MRIILITLLIIVSAYNYADLALKMCPTSNNKQWTLHGMFFIGI
jgi:hypothetical protein